MLKKVHIIFRMIPIFILLAGVAVVLSLLTKSVTYISAPKKVETRLFAVQSVDTMKYSRDKARETLGSSSFVAVIDREMELIAKSGATHVAIDTPYDEEFIPVLTAWVASARAHHLSVWFRGNFSGWEGWFSYPRMDRETHEARLNIFLQSHPDLFEDGDIFTPCPECENGGPGDPRSHDPAGYRKFLIDEYALATKNFNENEKSVAVYVSMNADIAKGVMDKATARALGGTILIDHYVRSADQLQNDIEILSKKLDAHIGIGEFGGPIPDINGYMNENDQAEFIKSLMNVLTEKRDTVAVVNYWVLQGGSTAIVNDQGNPRKAYTVLDSYFRAPRISGVVTNTLGEDLGGVTLSLDQTIFKTTTDYYGRYSLLLPGGSRKVTVQKDSYKPITFVMGNTLASSTLHDIVLEPENVSFWYALKQKIQTVVKNFPVFFKK